MKNLNKFIAHKLTDLSKLMFLPIVLFAMASVSLLSQTTESPSPPADAKTILRAALGVVSDPSSPSAYSVKGNLSDSQGKEYAKLTYTSHGLLDMREEVAGASKYVRVAQHGVGMENDEKSKSKSVRTRETLKPFHLLPTSDVLGELISKAEIKKISLDEKSSCQRFDLSVIPIGASNTLAQTLALCVDTTTKRVLYEEEPYWWSSASSASTLRRTFSQYSQMGGTLIPTLVKVSIDGRDTYSLQITAFDGTPDITPSTFQINMGGH